MISRALVESSLLEPCPTFVNRDSIKLEKQLIFALSVISLKNCSAHLAILLSFSSRKSDSSFSPFLWQATLASPYSAPQSKRPLLLSTPQQPLSARLVASTFAPPPSQLLPVQ